MILKFENFFNSSRHADEFFQSALAFEKNTTIRGRYFNAAVEEKRFRIEEEPLSSQDESAPRSERAEEERFNLKI